MTSSNCHLVPLGTSEQLKFLCHRQSLSRDLSIIVVLSFEKSIETYVIKENQKCTVRTFEIPKHTFEGEILTLIKL